MEIIKLAWVGTRTENADPTVAFFRDVLGLRLEVDQPGFWKMKLPDGSKVEVFGRDSEVNQHFTTGPVTGFLVDDLQGATQELRSAGVEIMTGPVTDQNGIAWVHFRAPDGNIYELTHDPEVSRPALPQLPQVAARPRPGAWWVWFEPSRSACARSACMAAPKAAQEEAVVRR